MNVARAPKQKQMEENIFELKAEHWLKCKQDNINLILQCQMQIMMANNIILLAEEQIKLHPTQTISHKEESES